MPGFLYLAVPGPPTWKDILVNFTVTSEMDLPLSSFAYHHYLHPGPLLLAS
jgi:hypothetical protein